MEWEGREIKYIHLINTFFNPHPRAHVCRGPQVGNNTDADFPGSARENPLRSRVPRVYRLVVVTLPEFILRMR
jgi:hypothetical protein